MLKINFAKMPEKVSFLRTKAFPKGMVDDDFEYSLGPPSSGFSIFLANRTRKVIRNHTCIKITFLGA